MSYPTYFFRSDIRVNISNFNWWGENGTNIRRFLYSEKENWNYEYNEDKVIFYFNNEDFAIIFKMKFG